MSNKKSLGHSPLGYDVIENVNFDFIPDYNALIESDDSDNFDESRESQKTEKQTDSFHSESETKDPENAGEKKIVSYYIDESITNRLRGFANDHNSSYSAAASDAIKEFVKNKGY